MTWLKFKECVEQQGIKDSDTITMIDWKDFERPIVQELQVPGFKIVVNEGVN